MPYDFKYSTLDSSTASEEIRLIIAHCFNVDLEDNSFFNRVGQNQFRVVQLNQKIIGGLALIPLRQWFGGSAVSMTGIASVAVSPEHRRVGAALFLLKNVLKELFDNQISLSALYPSNQALYYKAGYGIAGTTYGWEIDTQNINIDARALPVWSLDTENSRPLYPVYEKQASLENGHIERSSIIWDSIFHTQDHLYGYGLGTPEKPEGYFIYTQHSHSSTQILDVKDWVMLSPAATGRFWTFMSDQNAQISKVRWKGAAIDTLSMYLPTQSAQIRFSDAWMLRILNVKTALEARGYPQGVELDLHLNVKDPLIPDNSGLYILSVTGGKGAVTPGGKGDLQLDISALSPLYTGLFTPSQLEKAGYIQSTRNASLSASIIFSGGSPWMPDYF
jgi:predicted acetyltransferase